MDANGDRKGDAKRSCCFYIREENSFADLKSIVNCGFVVGLISGWDTSVCVFCGSHVGLRYNDG